MRQTACIGILTLAAFLGCAGFHSIKSTKTGAEIRALQSLEGLFNYYWKQDPINKDVEYFFACGAIGQLGVSSLDQCS